jgi:hypothetical protein
MQAPPNKKAKNVKKDVTDYLLPDQQVLYIEKMLKYISDMAEKLEIDLGPGDGQLVRDGPGKIGSQRVG